MAEHVFDVNKNFLMKFLGDEEPSREDLRELIGLLENKKQEILLSKDYGEDSTDEIETAEMYIENYEEIITSRYRFKEEVLNDLLVKVKEVHSIMEGPERSLEGIDKYHEYFGYIYEKYGIDVGYSQKTSDIIEEIENINDQDMWIFIDFGELFGFIGKKSRTPYSIRLLEKIE